MSAVAERAEIRPHPGPQEAFLASQADLAIFGGAAGGGKSWALLLEAWRHTHRPGFDAVIFRRTYPQITNPGGLWDESQVLYPLLNGVSRQDPLEWAFPGGGRVRFAHLQHEASKYDWKGAQIPLLCFDQLEEFSAGQFFYLLSRNRSLGGVRPYVRATCNPDPDSFLADFLAWWIDPETGFPIPERSGVVRYFVRVEDSFEWASSPEELRALYPDLAPKSVTFFPASLEDNPTLLRSDPLYRANLLALPYVERMRLLGGNWKVRATGGTVFNRAWLKIVDAAPAAGDVVRYWDKAGTAEEENPRAARTAGVRMKKHEGRYYIEHAIAGRWGAADREAVIQQTAETDGKSVAVWLEQEPGSGGKESAENTIRNLAGYNVRAEPVTGDKLTRAQPLAAQAEAGNVFLVRGSWNAEFLDELHAFPAGKLKDYVDASAGAFNKLALAVPQPRPNLRILGQ